MNETLLEVKTRLFNKAVGGLLKQGEAAQKEPNGGCYYRLEVEGKQPKYCVVGQLIPKTANWKTAFGCGASVKVLLDINPDLWRSWKVPQVFREDVLDLLKSLQTIHDRQPRRVWVREFTSIAKFYGITPGFELVLNEAAS